MQISFEKSFKKDFRKLSSKLQHKVDATIKRLEHNPYDPRLSNHALRGRLAGSRAISVTGDVRIIFVEQDNYRFVSLARVGTHSQVY